MKLTRTAALGVVSTLLASALVVGGPQMAAPTVSASDEGWTALGTGMAGIEPAWPGKRVFQIARASDGTLYAGGNFTSAGGVANTANLAKWNGSQWAPVADGVSVNGPVYAVALESDSALWIGGAFTSASPSGSALLARWNGTAFSTPAAAMTAPQTGEGVEEITVISPTEVYIGGNFSVSGQSASTGFVKFDGTALGPVGQGLDGGANKIVNGMTSGSSGVVIGGQFPSVNGGNTTARKIAQWDGTNWVTFGGATSGPADGLVAAVARHATSGHVAIGGNFTKVQNAGVDVAATKGLALWNGTAWESIGEITGAVVEELRVIGDHLYVGGEFSAIGGVTARNIARYNLTTRVWEPLIDGCQNGVNGVVRSIIDTGLNDGSIYVGGGFTNAGLVPEADGIAKFTPNSRGCRTTGEYLPPITNVRLQGFHADRVGNQSGIRVHVAWDVPEGAGYVQYTVTTRGLQTGGTFDPAVEHATPTCTSEVPSCSLFFPHTSIDSTMRGRQYFDVIYSVLGESSLGTALPVGFGPLTASPPPSAPQNVQVRGDWRAITVSWDRPADAGALITNYLVVASPHRRVCVTTVTALEESASRSCTFRNLRPNTDYSFSVQALSLAGWGSASAASAPVQPKNLKVESSTRSKPLFGFSRIRVAGLASGYAAGTEVKTFMRIGTGAWREITDAGTRVDASGKFSFTRVISPLSFSRPVSVRFEVVDQAACSVNPTPKDCGTSETVTLARR